MPASATSSAPQARSTSSATPASKTTSPARPASDALAAIQMKLCALARRHQALNKRINSMFGPNAVAAHVDHDAPDRTVLQSPADGRRKFSSRSERRLLARGRVPAAVTERCILRAVPAIGSSMSSVVINSGTGLDVPISQFWMPVLVGPRSRPTSGTAGRAFTKAPVRRRSRKRRRRDRPGTAGHGWRSAAAGWRRRPQAAR